MKGDQRTKKLYRCYCLPSYVDRIITFAKMPKIVDAPLKVWISMIFVGFIHFKRWQTKKQLFSPQLSNLQAPRRWKFTSTFGAWAPDTNPSQLPWFYYARATCVDSLRRLMPSHLRCYHPTPRGWKAMPGGFFGLTRGGSKKKWSEVTCGRCRNFQEISDGRCRNGCFQK